MESSRGQGDSLVDKTERLPQKHEVWSSAPTHTKPDGAAHSYNAITVETDVGQSLGLLAQVVLPSLWTLGSERDSFLKNRVQGA